MQWMEQHPMAISTLSAGCTAIALKVVQEMPLNVLLVVRWLCKVYASQFSIPDLMDSAACAARRGHLGILQMLATTNWFSHPKYLTPVTTNAFINEKF